MSATLSKSFKSQQQQQLGRCKQAAAVPRVAVRNSKRQQPVIKAVLTTIPRVAERSSGSNDSDSMGSLRVMSLISSLVDIEVCVFTSLKSADTRTVPAYIAAGLHAVTPEAFPPLKVSHPHTLNPHVARHNTAVSVSDIS